MRRCLVRGSGDVGSAVAHALFKAGFAVVIHDVGAPTYARRGRSFLDALFDGAAALEGVTAHRVDDLPSLKRMALRGRTIPITSAPSDAVLAAFAPEILVDARMRKRQVPEPQRGLALLTIGLGPNFIARGTTDLVVETAWGDDLGKVITAGPSAAFTGVPRVIAGYARERYGYAPADGRFEASTQLGIPVARGREVGRVGDLPIVAAIDGVVVGLTRSGTEVSRGAKVVEIDPRGRPGVAFGIGERARRIAQGVVAAIAFHEATSTRASRAPALHSTFSPGARI